MAFRASRTSPSASSATKKTPTGKSAEPEVVEPVTHFSVEDLVGAPKAHVEAPIEEKPKAQSAPTLIAESTETQPASDSSTFVRPTGPASTNAGFSGSRNDRPYAPRMGSPRSGNDG